MSGFETLDNKFAVAIPTPGTLPPPEPEQEMIYDPTKTSDIDLAKQALRDALTKSKEMAETMERIATLNESARGFEVAGNLLKLLADTAMQLIKASEEPDRGKAAVTHNHIFVGSTYELLRAIKQAKDETVVDANEVQIEEAPNAGEN